MSTTVDPWDHFNDFSAALKHVLNIFDVNAPPLIISSIQEERITQVHELVDLDRDFDDEPLQTTKLGKAKNGTVPPYHRHALKRVQGYARSFREGANSQPASDAQWMKVTLEEVNIQWTNRAKKPAVARLAPGPPHSRPAPNPADLFEKGIRRDMADFPTLSSQAKFTSWQKEFETTIYAQNLANILDPNYVPATADDQRLWRLQQDYVFKVFYAKLLTDKGKALVQLHSNDRNAQGVYQALLKHAHDSSAAVIEVNKYTDFLTNSRLDST